MSSEFGKISIPHFLAETLSHPTVIKALKPLIGDSLVVGILMSQMIKLVADAVIALLRKRLVTKAVACLDSFGDCVPFWSIATCVSQRIGYKGSLV